MAKAYVMIAKDQLERLMKKEDEKPATQVVVMASDNLNSAISELVDSMPKKYQNRTKALLKFLKPYLSVSENNQVILSHKDQIYDTLWDLIFYLFLPESFVSRTARPINGHDFVKSLVELRVPKRLLKAKFKLVNKLVNMKQKK